MKQIGNFYVFKNIEELQNRQTHLKGKIVIFLAVRPNPEKSWAPNAYDKRKEFWQLVNPNYSMPPRDTFISYFHEKNKKLKELGLLSDAVLNEFKDCETFVFVATEFADLETAKEVFEKACRAHIVDIYLEQDCKHVLKYD